MSDLTFLELFDDGGDVQVSEEFRASGLMTVSWEYSLSRAIVRASSRGVSVVTLRAGGSWRSSIAEKRYFEEGEAESGSC